MKVRRSKWGARVAVSYLILVLIVCSPLIMDGAIHHGNGIAVLAAILLTSPFSWLLFSVLDNLTGSNWFYMTGGLYYIYMCALGACALTNAAIIYVVISRFSRESK